MTVSARVRTRTSPGRPSSNAKSRMSRSPKAWNVPIVESVYPYGTSWSTRSCISAAAFSVNVRARISDGFARRVATSQAIRRVITCVFPVPAPATTRSGPSPCVTARSCSGFSPPRSASNPVAGSPAGVIGVSGPNPSQTGICSSAVGSRRRRERIIESPREIGSGAMSEPSPGPVTPSLSGRTDAVGAGRHGSRWTRPGRRQGLTESLAFLLGQGTVGSTGRDRLGVDPRPGARVQAADDEPVPERVGQRKREALVAAGVLERIEPDEPDALDRATVRRLDDRRPGGHVVERAGDREDLVEMGVEDAVQALAVCAARQPVEALADPAGLAGEEENEDQQDEDRDREPDDDGAEDRFDGGVQIDRSVLGSRARDVRFGAENLPSPRSAGRPSLANGPSPPGHLGSGGDRRCYPPPDPILLGV